MPRTTTEPKPGDLFSQVYFASDVLHEDSPTMRARLGAYVHHELHADHWDLSVHLKKEAGHAPTTFAGPNRVFHKFEEFVAGMPRDQLMNFITHVWRFLDSKHGKIRQTGPGTWTTVSQPALEWRSFVARVFREENLGYVIDDRAGVRFLVDRQFELQRESILACLSDKQYTAARVAFDDAHRYFAKTPQDLKAALRSLFESVEIVAKQHFSSDRLTAKLVTEQIKPAILSNYPDDPIAKRAVGRVVDGFADWVDGMHHYRHGQGDEEPVVPPADFAVYAMSSGSAFIRWLVQSNSQ